MTHARPSLSDSREDSDGTVDSEGSTNVSSSLSDNVSLEDILKEQWKWSADVTDYVVSHIEGRSLKICTGLTPCCDVNLDILPLADCIGDFDLANYSVDDDGAVRPTAEAHHSLGGQFVQGDAFDVPYPDKSFDTVVSDPPWRGKSESERRALFEECIRLVDVGGLIIYNATWLPEAEKARLRKERFRQEDDFCGNPSFLTFYRRTADDLELIDHYDYPVDSHSRAVVMSRHVDSALVTNPNALDPNITSYHCPKCGCTRLGQLGETANPHDPYEYDLYECAAPDCGFRISESELQTQASHVEAVGPDSWTEWQSFIRAKGYSDWAEAMHDAGSAWMHS